MMRVRALHNRWVGAGLTAVAAVALLALTAAPVFADPAATSWTVDPKSKTVTYGEAVLLSGTLKSGATTIPGLWVDLGQGTTAVGSFEIIYKITTPQASGTARYEVAVIPHKTVYYLFRWGGDATYAASDSDVIPVQVMPALGAPTNGTSITVGKKLTVKGSVTPGAPGGPAVKIKAYRKKGDGSWTGYRTYAGKVSGTQYSQSVTIARTGKFKFKAVSVAGTEYAAGQSGFGRVLTVKQ